MRTWHADQDGTMKPLPLFDQKTIDTKFSKIAFSQEQRKIAHGWIEKLNGGGLEKEQENYFTFRDDILRDLLGYPERRINFSKQFVEFSAVDDKGVTAACIECKGAKTKDLFARQHYGKKEQETPFIQTYTNMGRFPEISYGVCTNYKDFVLLIHKYGTTKCHQFNFLDIGESDDKLREFLGIFSYENLIIKKIHGDLYKDSATAEKKLTEEFYQIFKETREMLIESFVKNGQIDKNESIHFAQLYLNRLIFVFFLSDNGLLKRRLFTEGMKKLLGIGHCASFSRSVWSFTMNLFSLMDRGQETPHYFGYNGGLFREAIPQNVYFSDMVEPKEFDHITRKIKIKKRPALDEFISKEIDQYGGRLSPIILNLLIMDSYSFKNEINVYILGHIFEQSIADIEILKKQTVSKRKRQGVFYTPEYITDYICRSTIIASLSEKNSSTVAELIDEHEDNLAGLESKIRNIRILDPACGSGAFLVKATQTLLDIDREMQNRRRAVPSQTKITEYSAEKEIVKIIEKNIFGIDINKESNEITKLSLFLEMTTIERKLPNLSRNILNGNSIIDCESHSPNPFKWDSEFREIIKGGGFDIIIGNPPYIPTELMSDTEKEFYSTHFRGIFRKYDTSVLFIENCLKYLKPNGHLGFIVPLTWQTGNNYQNFRKLIFSEQGARLTSLVNLPFDVFKDPYVDTGIAIFKKTVKIDAFRAYMYPKYEKINNVNDNLGEFIRHERIFNQPDYKVLPSDIIYERLSKAGVNFETLGAVTKSVQGIVTSKYAISDTKKSKAHLPFLLKADANRYRFLVKKSGFIDSTKIPTIVDLYTGPKIIIRRIISRQNRLMAFHEDSGIVTNKDYNPFVVTSNDNDVFYILGIVNSKFFSYLYYFTSAIAQKDDYRQTTLTELRKMPIAKASKGRKKNVSAKARRLTNLTSRYFAERDRILRRVSENFQIKITDKLSDITNIEFEEFKTEIELLSKNKMPLDEQDQWNEYLQKNKSKLVDLRNEIESVENELDELVYGLYCVTKKEKRLIEQNILETPF